MDFLNRRNFLKYSTGLAAATVASSIPLLGAEGSGSAMGTATDAINPRGIRVAGIRMIPVVGGKYKVWTKQLGSGPLKVLLLHGGPGFPHDYLEAMESFLPQAGIEMYYYDQLGVGNSEALPQIW